MKTITINVPDDCEVQIVRKEEKKEPGAFWDIYHFLAFHTREQRDNFLKYNEQLVKDYLMID